MNAIFKYKDFDFRYGIGAWEKFCELQGIEFHEIASCGIFPIRNQEKTGYEIHFDPFVFKKLIYSGLWYASKFNKIPLEKTLDDMDFIYDEMEEDEDAIQNLTMCILKSLNLGESKKNETPIPTQ